MTVSVAIGLDVLGQMMQTEIAGLAGLKAHAVDLLAEHMVERS